LQISGKIAVRILTRENVQRKIVVMCNVAGRDLSGVVNDVPERVRIAVPLPQGYRVEYGGQFESEAAASSLLLWLGIAVVLGILVILTTAFGSLADALIIMCNLPLALIGGVVGVFLSGGILSVASMIGFITLFGIAARNGIMLVSHIKHVQKEEGITDLREAILKGASERLTPILMTALCAGLALIPIALAQEKQAARFRRRWPWSSFLGCSPPLPSTWWSSRQCTFISGRDLVRRTKTGPWPTFLSPVSFQLAFLHWRRSTVAL